MKETYLFEYAVIRVVPQVEREEFLNVGVVLYCKKENFLQSIIRINENRLGIFTQTLDVEELSQHLQAFEKICKGGKEAGTIGMLDTASRFRWLTATRSTIVQCSKVHPGLCSNAQETIEKLFAQLVN